MTALLDTIDDLRKQLAAMKADRDALKERVLHECRQTHDGPCYYCGKDTNSFSGRPSLWPCGPICHPDDPGKVKYHHAGCVMEKLQQLAASQARCAQLEQQKDAVYLERNQVVAALARCFPSGLAKTAIPGWSEDWHHCVYIDLPTGQVSWHYHDSQAALFDGLPPYQHPWDGHDTDEKYHRLGMLKHAPTFHAIQRASP